MDTVADLVAALAGRDDPVLTWYARDERVDFTGRTLANWTTKATNLVAGDLGLGPGDEVWLDLPGHWRTLVWAVGAWCAGARVTLEPGEAPAVVTDSPGEAHAGLDLVVIALPALARHVEDLPSGAIDGAADLMSQADAYVLAPEGGPDHETGLGRTQRELLAEAPPLAEVPGAGGGGPRVLVRPDPVGQLLSAAPAIWAAGGSVVISADDDVAGAEGVTHTLA